MSTLKRFLKYIIWLVLFFIFSEFLINVGLASSYKPLERKDSFEQVVIQDAESTLVNGKIIGTINNPAEIDGKYLRIDIYSERNMLLGTRYIDLEKATSSQEFKVFYELEDSTSYEISFVNEKTDQELKIIPDEWTKPEIVLATALTFLIFWG